MALLEFFCEYCQVRFEQISSGDDPERGKCPKCQGKNTRRLISKFFVSGRGDLRETTFHGCHGVHVPLQGDASNGDHSHEHSHDHGDGHSEGGSGSESN